ncbi:hypothetical protein ACOME3_009838 [Neoechinorhynchus agilis]
MNAIIGQWRSCIRCYQCGRSFHFRDADCEQGQRGEVRLDGIFENRIILKTYNGNQKYSALPYNGRILLYPLSNDITKESSVTPQNNCEIIVVGYSNNALVKPDGSFVVPDSVGNEDTILSLCKKYLNACAVSRKQKSNVIFAPLLLTNVSSKKVINCALMLSDRKILIATPQGIFHCHVSCPWVRVYDKPVSSMVAIRRHEDQPVIVMVTSDMRSPSCVRIVKFHKRRLMPSKPIKLLTLKKSHHVQVASNPNDTDGFLAVNLIEMQVILIIQIEADLSSTVKCEISTFEFFKIPLNAINDTVKLPFMNFCSYGNSTATSASVLLYGFETSCYSINPENGMSCKICDVPGELLGCVSCSSSIYILISTLVAVRSDKSNEPFMAWPTEITEYSLITHNAADLKIIVNSRSGLHIYSIQSAEWLGTICTRAIIADSFSFVTNNEPVPIILSSNGCMFTLIASNTDEMLACMKADHTNYQQFNIDAANKKKISLPRDFRHITHINQNVGNFIVERMNDSGATASNGTGASNDDQLKYGSVAVSSFTSSSSMSSSSIYDEPSESSCTRNPIVIQTVPATILAGANRTTRTAPGNHV